MFREVQISVITFSTASGQTLPPVFIMRKKLNDGVQKKLNFSSKKRLSVSRMETLIGTAGH